MAAKSERLFEILKKRIVHLEYSPGQVLNEAEIASEFGLIKVCSTVPSIYSTLSVYLFCTKGLFVTIFFLKASHPPEKAEV
jgi:hypothetical protein